MTAEENIAWYPRTEEPRSSQRNTWNNQIRNHAVMRGDQTALRYLDKEVSWGRFAERVGAFAGALAKRGITAGDRVLILGLNRIEYVEAALGVTALGGIAVPVNFRMAPPEVAYLVQDTKCSAVIYEAPFDPLVAGVAGAGADFGLRIRFDGADEAAGAVGFEDLIAEGNPDPHVDVPEDSPALIMYTSGTTGRPKGAVLTHINMTAQGWTNLVAPGSVDPEAVGAIAVPMFHIAGFGVLATAFLQGLTSVIFPLGAFDPAQTLDALEREGITSMFMVPMQWQLAVAEQKARPRNLKLRYVWWGAAPASETLLRELTATFPDAEICAVFGQTEMSPVTCALSGADTLRKFGSVGKVVRTVAARVIDPDGNDVPRGQIGEIVYRGPNMMSGYWNNLEATREAFAGGWFHSGDLVRMDEEGFVYVVDRAKDMIISGGENIYSQEVENAVAAHPDVTEVAVIGKPDEKWGEAVVAVVQLREGAELTVDTLSAFLTDHIARYKHPRHVVVIDALPRNPTGKVTKPTLRQQFG
ncbi:AMP-dependent synthetase and ligase OS=Tsukamurella paurometabola (strain ATCC 8368 / DSM /CCUG 35730 / CIP 100753 / JCM 10117 / KCTC 9821 / NBRC 16120/ NCIMB 702349 / NCTC 13040) OX=521096 GN=Tpau_4181 PE=3 SV=1 [Tsukamurella paurometabola]|uniref:AMP-dependent synthetase and ligase n=1 Tax=Tsukamurella paurometabola (strain ATCC 8368 / DSM 20162 / CCUG 35730 / CIP 100753 / JCM 10117 / KCTC 9821 / NBRC 16120 / NCIMB 702349 / NCTC 13040) TaxID=521096 RepID=D5UP41_TSUPD|nr:long-chain-fatty-acid--CoA ligase [Tsukamurella paurometabola]ADG80750.1 AMP-dependent synthetase and ligase [Tsukamurella paurometabola DSM 20162]SUP40823.1 Long-chain-fatty-acid--CoA ligase [Tsukamurella paurometabola]